MERIGLRCNEGISYGKPAGKSKLFPHIHTKSIQVYWLSVKNKYLHVTVEVACVCLSLQLTDFSQVFH